jgi:hypothetical protein
MFALAIYLIVLDYQICLTERVPEMILAIPDCQLKHYVCKGDSMTDILFPSLAGTTMTTCHGLATLDSGTLCT